MPECPRACICVCMRLFESVLVRVYSTNALWDICVLYVNDSKTKQKKQRTCLKHTNSSLFGGDCLVCCVVA